MGEAEGSRGAAAALACAGADVDLAALLVDVGGRPPRPTLLASAAARELEERLVAHLPQARVAARGQVCHLAVAADPEGLDAAAAAVTVARGALAVLHLPPALLRPCLDERLGPEPSGVLLRADLAADRALLALVVRDLIARDLAVAVLKRRLGWVAERRALFGSLAPEAAGGLPRNLRRRRCGSRPVSSDARPGLVRVGRFRLRLRLRFGLGSRLRGDRGMPGADVLDPLAVDVAALRVAGEAVERAALEGHLGPAVGSFDRAELDRAGRLDPGGNDERVPGGDAGAGADEPALGLGAEAVEGAALGSGEDRLAEGGVLRLLGHPLGRLSRRSPARRTRPGGATWIEVQSRIERRGARAWRAPWSGLGRLVLRRRRGMVRPGVLFLQFRPPSSFVHQCLPVSAPRARSPIARVEGCGPGASPARR